MESIWWSAVGAGGIVGLRQIGALVVREPIKRIAADLLGLKIFAKIWPFRDPTFGGAWTISWEVKSARFPENNVGVVQMYRMLDRVGAQTKSPTLAGEELSYGFVGQLSGPVITGTWFDRTDRVNGYHGAFQVIVDPTRAGAEGIWVGFSRDGKVKHGRLVWRRAKDS